jgi:hypothetical protein
LSIDWFFVVFLGAGGRGGDGDGDGIRGQGQEAGRGRRQEDVCTDLLDLELKRGREGTLQHGPGAILEGAIGSCRDPTSPPKSPSSR